MIFLKKFFFKELIIGIAIGGAITTIAAIVGGTFLAIQLKKRRLSRQQRRRERFLCLRTLPDRACISMRHMVAEPPEEEVESLEGVAPIYEAPMEYRVEGNPYDVLVYRATVESQL